MSKSARPGRELRDARSSGRGRGERAGAGLPHLGPVGRGDAAPQARQAVPVGELRRPGVVVTVVGGAAADRAHRPTT